MGRHGRNITGTGGPWKGSRTLPWPICTGIILSLLLASGERSSREGVVERRTFVLFGFSSCAIVFFMV